MFCQHKVSNKIFILINNKLSLRWVCFAYDGNWKAISLFLSTCPSLLLFPISSPVHWGESNRAAVWVHGLAYLDIYETESINLETTPVVLDGISFCSLSLWACFSWLITTALPLKHLYDTGSPCSTQLSIFIWSHPETAARPRYRHVLWSEANEAQRPISKHMMTQEYFSATG